MQTLLTASNMVGCINAIVGGVSVALAVRSLLEVPVAAAAVIGAVVPMVLAAYPPAHLPQPTALIG